MKRGFVPYTSHCSRYLRFIFRVRVCRDAPNVDRAERTIYCTHHVGLAFSPAVPTYVSDGVWLKLSLLDLSLS